MDEGYIKFQPFWTKTAAFPESEFHDLLKYRQRCYERKWIGVYPDGIGFGNISERITDSETFFISGSATGSIPILGPKQVAKVTAVVAVDNKLWCSGPILASSESMSHAVIYEQLPWVNGVIHIHHLGLWQYLLNKVPTTPADAPYGSPEMVAGIIRLLETTDLPTRKLFVMEGHEEGIFAFGQDLEEAFGVLEAAYHTLSSAK
ncbi:class II aldolase/adducin family protein [Lewinella cohaerens]|uniref:class II aldolase/adducin family protein n=1 Tax=Lewinella cohaerens TaxID=70995 RepID=UPI0003807437|nr:class II aldolase/adducin family protein [Lewinella cohaerens]